MRGHRDERFGRTRMLALATGLLLATMPGAAAAEDFEVTALPRCRAVVPPAAADGVVSVPWQVVLDEDGAVAAHRITLRHRGADTTLHTGRRGFAVPMSGDRLLIGERDDSGTRLDLVDVRRACRVWSRSLGQLIYPERDGVEGRNLRFSTHDRNTGRYGGSLLLDGDSGASGGLIDGECIENCIANDGDISLAALEPAGAIRPTPNFGAGGWPKDRTLPFRWPSGGVPPTWAKSPLLAAADDAARTSDARSPVFAYRSDATNPVAYTGTLPGYCGSAAIACAGRSMPATWGAWIRPHGTDYAWGTLRWCQKSSSRSGCFDIRRVLLHELGHIAGLNHPSSAGFTLSGNDSIMQSITPSRPTDGSSRHAFGRCDVATLQELYDTPDNKTLISSCNVVSTELRLSASRPWLPRGQSVKLQATLSVADKSAYRELGGNPLNGRTVKLKYRRAGSADAWQTAWMRSTYSSGRYVVTLSPASTSEFKAVFSTPQDEGLRYSSSDIVKVKVTS